MALNDDVTNEPAGFAAFLGTASSGGVRRRDCKLDGLYFNGRPAGQSLRLTLGPFECTRSDGTSAVAKKPSKRHKKETKDAAHAFRVIHSKWHARLSFGQKVSLAFHRLRYREIHKCMHRTIYRRSSGKADSVDDELMEIWTMFVHSYENFGKFRGRVVVNETMAESAVWVGG